MESYCWFNNWKFNKVEKTEEVQNSIESKIEESSAVSNSSEIEKLKKEIEELKNNNSLNNTKTLTNQNIVSDNKLNNLNTNSVVINEKPSTQDQTQKYKNDLTNQIMEMIAILKNGSDYVDQILPHIDNRINILNNMVLENQSLVKSAPSSLAVDLTNNLISIYKVDNEFSEITKDALKGYKDLNQKIIDSLSTDGIVIINKLTSISSDEFNRYYNSNIKLKNEVDSIFSSIKDKENKWLISIKEQNNDYDNFFAQLKIKIENMKLSSNVNTQIYYPAPQLTIPTIKIPKVQKCYFSSYGKSYGSLTEKSGTITCY